MLQKKSGVGVIIKRDSLLLLGKRTTSIGYGTWAPPGGLIELNETLEDAARREVFEETGLTISSVVFLATAETIFAEHNHYAESFMVEALYIPGILLNKEPDKCQQWAWFEWNHLPQPLFAPFQNFVNQGNLRLVF